MPASSPTHAYEPLAGEPSIMDYNSPPLQGQDTDSQLGDPPSSTPRCFGLLSLDSQVSSTNFAAYLAAASAGIGLFVFINASQSFVLGQVLTVPKSQLGTAAGTLTFADELLSLPMVFVWGLASDVVGRRVVYAAGFAIMALGLALFPTATNLYPELLIY
ncbi:hypothetical protein BDK51DRAFT_26870, partial [Blyttiomyces helicus]